MGVVEPKVTTDHVLRDLLFLNIPFPFTKMSKLLLLFSLRSIYIYIPTVYTSPPSPRYSRFPPFFPLDYGGPCSGGSNIKRGFLDCELWRFPQNSNSLNPQINIAFPPTTRLFKYLEGV